MPIGNGTGPLRLLRLSRLSEAHAGEAGLDEDQIVFQHIELLVGGNETDKP